MSFIVFCGLPGSGKSTVARDVAVRVRLPVLDKDDFLEALFAERGPGDGAWRTTLSREADERFATAARELPGACLVSWWRPPNIDNPSGTPSEWLADLPATVVQVHCRCSVETAVERFLTRRRHPGHLDSVRSRESLLREFAKLESAVPIRGGTVIEVGTEQPVDADALTEQLLMTLGNARLDG